MEYENIVFFFCLLGLVNSEIVPLFMWGNEGVSKKISALQRVDQKSFQDDFNEKLKNKELTAVVFIEKSLSSENFILKDQSGKTPFKYMSEVEKSSKVSYMPNVEDPIKAIRNIDEDISELSFQKLSDNIQALDNVHSRIIVIELDGVQIEEKPYDMFQRHDEFIHSIYKYLLKTRKAVVAMYTGLQSLNYSGKIHSRKIRSVTSDSNQLFENGTIYFYSTGATMKLLNENDPKNYDFKDVNLTYQAEKDNNTDIITLRGHGVPANTSLTLLVVFQFNKTNTGYWYFLGATFTYLNETINVTSKDTIEAPTTFSYACGSELFFDSDEPDKTINRTLKSITFSSFQVQPLYVDTTLTVKLQFNDAYNCVGFTTIPIWSGIFVTFILMIIMSVGLTMIMDIKTTDRFDDAKGKTITINVSE